MARLATIATARMIPIPAPAGGLNRAYKSKTRLRGLMIPILGSGLILTQSLISRMGDQDFQGVLKQTLVPDGWFTSTSRY